VLFTFSKRKRATLRRLVRGCERSLGVKLSTVGKQLVMKMQAFILSGALLSLGVPSLAIAQQQPPAPAVVPYVDTVCGSWKDDTWVTNGTCTGEVKKHARVEGTITMVKGHLVTIQQTTGTLVIDDTPALDNKFTGKVAVGRRVVAHGYWVGENFYASMMTTDEGGKTS
jgi:hypothetical protein